MNGIGRRPVAVECLWDRTRHVDEQSRQTGRPADDVRQDPGRLPQHLLSGWGSQVRDRSAFPSDGRPAVNVSCAGGRVRHRLQSIFPPHARGLEPTNASTPHAGVAATLHFVRNRVLEIMERDPCADFWRCSRRISPDEVIPTKRNCDHPAGATCAAYVSFLIDPPH